MTPEQINQIKNEFESWFERQYSRKPTPSSKSGDLPHTSSYMTMFADGAWKGWQANAIFQSQKSSDPIYQVWQPVDFGGEFWSFDDATKEEYDKAEPENRRMFYADPSDTAEGRAQYQAGYDACVKEMAAAFKASTSR